MMPDAYARHLAHLVPLLYLLNHQIGGVTSLSSSCAQCPLYLFSHIMTSPRSAHHASSPAIVQPLQVRV